MLVCEGYAEDRFARVIHDLYLPRNCGSTLQRKNARGYGGARALKLVLQLQRQTAHDTYGSRSRLPSSMRIEATDDSCAGGRSE